MLCSDVKQIFVTIVKKFSVCGSETWKRTVTDKRELLTEEMDVLRRSWGISKKKKEKRKEIKEIVKLKEVIFDYIQ